jgi:acetyltransferase-like isoleucine patch superfamily enzyme
VVLRALANRARSWVTFTLKYRWVRAGGMVRIPWSVEFWSPHEDIQLGDSVQFGKGCVVSCDARFGNKVLIGRRVAFVGRDDHRYDVVGKTIWDSPRGDRLRVVVEDDVWIGHGAIILSGVTVSTGAVVAAGSVVSRDVPPYAVVAGNPARVVKMRFVERQIREHEELMRNST